MAVHSVCIMALSSARFEGVVNPAEGIFVEMEGIMQVRQVIVILALKVAFIFKGELHCRQSELCNAIRGPLQLPAPEQEDPQGVLFEEQDARRQAGSVPVLGVRGHWSLEVHPAPASACDREKAHSQSV